MRGAKGCDAPTNEQVHFQTPIALEGFLMSAKTSHDKGWLGVVASLILAWNGCGYVSQTASVYEDADFLTVYDSSGEEHILEAPAGWRPRPNKNRNVPLGAVLIVAAVGVGLWSMCQFE